MSEEKENLDSWQGLEGNEMRQKSDRVRSSGRGRAAVQPVVKRWYLLEGNFH